MIQLNNLTIPNRIKNELVFTQLSFSLKAVFFSFRMLLFSSCWAWRLTAHVPVDVGDEAGGPFADAHTFARQHVVDVYERVVGGHCQVLASVWERDTGRESNTSRLDNT